MSATARSKGDTLRVGRSRTIFAMDAHKLGALGASLAVVVGLAGCGSATGDSGASPSSQLAEFSTKTEYQRIAPTDPPLTPASSKPAAGGTKGTWTYTVVAKDYLYGIADRFGKTCKADAIAKTNEWPEGVQHPIFADDKILMPVTCDATVVVTPPVNSTPTAGPVTGGGAVTAGGTYTIQPDDTLYGIAKKTGTTLDAILEANGWTDKEPSKILIYKGMVIKLPAKG
jgi:LysM repeat protein